jgi:hypothetical protein
MTSSDRKFVAVMVIGAGALLAAWALDIAFISTRVLTDFKGRSALSPLYAFWMPTLTWRVLVPTVVAAGYCAWVWWIQRLGDSLGKLQWAALLTQCVWLATIAVAVALVRLPLNNLGASMHVYPGEEFWDDVPKAKDPLWFLENFHSLHSRQRLSLHGRTHPPGHTLFLWVVTRLFGPSSQAAALAILLVGSTAVIPVYLTARHVFGADTAQRVLALYPVVPSVAVFAVSSTDSLFAALAAWSLWIAVEAVEGRNTALAVAAGLAGGLAAMFSFAQAFVGLIVGGFAIVRWVERPGGGVGRQILGMAIGLVAAYFTLRWGFGFDWLDAQQLTRRWYWHVVTVVPGKLTAGFWVYVAMANPLAFGLCLGSPVVAGSVLSIRSAWRTGLWTGRTHGAFVCSLWMVVAMMNFAGLLVLITLEVERIWLFLVGPVVAAACHEIPGSPQQNRNWTVFLAGVLCAETIAHEALLFTIW